MEDKHWYELMEELSLEVVIIHESDRSLVKTTKKTISVFYYNPYLLKYANKFIGECRQNITEFGRVPENFNDLLFKLNKIFKQQFGIDFPDGNIKYPLNYKNITIPEVNIEKDPEISVLQTRIDAFDLVITILRKILNDNKKIAVHSKKISKVNIQDFRSEYDNKLLIEKFKEAINMGFMSRDIATTEVIKIFNGRATTEKIDWLDTIYTLNKFIKGINGKAIKKLNHGKWEVVSKLFLVKGKSVKFTSLKNPSKGINDRLNDVEILIGEFNEEDLL